MNDAPTKTLQKAIDKLAERQAAPETFNALVRLATNPSACKARIDQLKRALDKAEAAEAKLAERQALFDAKVATEKAELDERKSALNARLLQLLHREAACEQIIQKDRTARLDRSRPLAGGMTITQEQP